MLRIFFILVLVAGFSSSPGAKDQLLIKNANLVSPERDDIVYGVDVLIDGSTITAINPNLSLSAPEATVIDATGKFLTPGLIDSHVHLYHATGLKRQYTDKFETLYASYMKQMPKSYLYFGYTTLIELNSNFQTNDFFTEQAIRPRLFHCGQGVVLPNGFMSLEYPDGTFTNVFPNYLLDTYQSPPPVNNTPENHTPEAVVNNVKKQGGICIKLYYEEARWWPGERPEYALPSTSIIRDVVDASRKLGMPVLLHATAAEGYTVGLEAGINIFAHGPWDWTEKGHKLALSPSEEVYNVIEKAAASSAAIQPTMRTLLNTASLYTPAILEHPQLPSVLPADFITYLKTDAQAQKNTFFSIFAPSVGARSPEEVRKMQKKFIDNYQDLIGLYWEKDGSLLFGTDTAVGGFGWGNPPGLNGYLEMKGWQKAGISLEAIFKAATIDNAKAFGLDEQIGTIRIGKKADLLLMRGNPLEDISAYDQIEMVITDGRPIYRDHLSAKTCLQSGSC